MEKRRLELIGEKKITEIKSGLLEMNKSKICHILEDLYPVDIAILLEEFVDEDLVKFHALINNELMAKII